MSDNENQTLVAQILSAYLSNNSVSPADLAAVIATVKAGFGGDSPFPKEGESQVTKTYEPAVPVKKSVTPEAITCLCCGAKFKSLKRHLRTEHQMSPEDYRAAFGLKADYPLVAPNYAAQRSALAKSLGLGRLAGKNAEPRQRRPARKRARKKPPHRSGSEVKMRGAPYFRGVSAHVRNS